MPDYDADPFDARDRPGEAPAAFEDPRFADDRPRRTGGGSGRKWTWGCGCAAALAAAGAVSVLLCCGGLLRFGLEAKADRIRAAIAADPGLREPLAEQLGEPYGLEPEMWASLVAPVGEEVFAAVGPRASATLTVRSDGTGDDLEVLGATLELPDGSTRELTPGGGGMLDPMREVLERLKRPREIRGAEVGPPDPAGADPQSRRPRGSPGEPAG